MDCIRDKDLRKINFVNTAVETVVKANVRNPKRMQRDVTKQLRKKRSIRYAVYKIRQYRY